MNNLPILFLLKLPLKLQFPPPSLPLHPHRVCSIVPEARLTPATDQRPEAFSWKTLGLGRLPQSFQLPRHSYFILSYSGHRSASQSILLANNWSDITICANSFCLPVVFTNGENGVPQGQFRGSSH